MAGGVENKKFATAPTWRVLYPGLNLQGKCTARGCEATGDLVDMKCGFGQADVLHIETKCPKCGGKLDGAIKVLFMKCHYKVSAVTKSGQMIGCDWRTVRKGTMDSRRPVRSSSFALSSYQRVR